MRPYSTIRGWLVRMVRRGLGRRSDRKSTGKKKILNPQTLKKIMGWTRRDPSRYRFWPASWRLDMVNEMIRRETGKHARPRTLRRILFVHNMPYFGIDGVSTPDPARCGGSCAASAFRTPSLGRCRARSPLQRSRDVIRN